jgi:hypothetical protein
VRPHLNRKKLGMAAHACYLCNVGKLKIGAWGPSWTGRKVRPYLQNN